MFGDGALTFREFAMKEQLPLATIHDAVLEFLRGRDDAVLYGAQAVNAYVSEPRMTQDVDLVSTRAEELAEELRAFLNQRFHTAVRIREAREGVGWRVYQERKPQNRYLVDVRQVEVLPPAKRVKKVLVVTPPELIANKVASMVSRAHKPKGLIDKADLYRLLLAFPELKEEQGPVAELLTASQAAPECLAAWQELVTEEIEPKDDEEKFRR